MRRRFSLQLFSLSVYLSRRQKKSTQAYYDESTVAASLRNEKVAVSRFREKKSRARGNAEKGLVSRDIVVDSLLQDAFRSLSSKCEREKQRGREKGLPSQLRLPKSQLSLGRVAQTHNFRGARMRHAYSPGERQYSRELSSSCACAEAAVLFA